MADDTLLTADDPSVSSQTATPTYGIYLVDADGAPQPVFDGTTVPAPDSFIGYGYANDSRISQYPLEGGAFQQYNKVDTPFDVRVTMTKGGKTSVVSQFIAKVESMAKATDLNLYTIITPERTYNSVNVQRVTHDHKRDHGANMVTVEMQFIEIRETAGTQYTTTAPITDAKQPSSKDAQSAGTVQPTAVTTPQGESVSQALKNAELAQNRAQMTH